MLDEGLLNFVERYGSAPARGFSHVLPDSSEGLAPTFAQHISCSSKSTKLGERCHVPVTTGTLAEKGTPHVGSCREPKDGGHDKQACATPLVVTS